MRRMLALAGALILVLATGATAHAQINDDPAVDGTTGLFVIPRAGTLEEGAWAIGAYYGAVMYEEGDSRIRTLGFMGGYGLTDRLELTLQFDPSVKIDRRYTSEMALFKMDPYLCCTGINNHPFASGRILSPPFFRMTPGEEYQGIGYLNVGAKVKFVGDPYEYNGMALQGWMQVPTSEASEGIGAGAFGLGGKLIGSLEAGEFIGWNAYAGYRWTDTPHIDTKLPYDPRIEKWFISPELLYGVGFQFPTRAWLQVLGEWQGSVTTRDVSAAYTGGDDVSLLQVGIRATFDSGLALGAATNYNTTINVRDADWQPDADAVDDALRRWGWLFTASYSTSRRQPLMFMGTAPMDLPMLNAAPTLTCRAERTSIRSGESVRLMATASDPDNDPLTISWNASAGSLSSTTGTEVTWDSRGVPAGAGPVRARVTDGYGGIADCEIRVAVEAAPPMAQATTLNFVCSEFPAGNSRIDNRCKAVLDDVALQLRQNPGATAAITGHADVTGTAEINMQMATERANNAKAYLVETHGIDASRITATSASSSTPVADNSTRAGQATNRRIEIVVTIPPR